ncbi:glutamate ABC transporter substrate-binding protein [Corynebacterium jeikeium]|jgi:glutamate transport system substrate-binding protein|uniref:Glutamate ABC transport system, solute-binding protein n=1 Tax=Corynebacterium jeikeium (strain K411) TaxID=306537 RepID=Q4JWJ0_CORJK|nr:glutamate ABC transporter substrate-binding protein [Corynebacterium jeikeium]EEW16981.1 ABC transporter, substrate-binding protein, family 3 [Corynebacterium jeikeium ATCC 43734]OOD30476.1 glutamate-binding protein [Corynebacterium jeikeium]WCZ53219.1 ABC transporter glutamine-binding protein GlnH precursor [Corynebacterium jeikeium]CAI36817.1 glutamate ABC transport system, solute-binding protein [Corynebacterium jeikeium K411]SQI23916.1 glutamate ABC transport system, solute-binding prot
MSTFKSALKRLTAAVVATASVVALTACGSGGARDLLADIESGHVVMGTKYDQPNLGERTPDKQFAGLDTDVSRYVVEYIAKKHGWATPEIEWRETPSAQRETLINNGEVNMITATYSINKGRLKAVDFAGPYVVTHQALLVREDSGINGLNDIAPGTRLCSVSGSTPAQKVKDALPEVQLQEFDTYAACAEGLKQGVVDATTTDATILAGFAQRYKERFDEDYSVIQLKNDDGSFWTNENYGIGLPKGDDKAKAEVNEALNEMHDSGEFQKIVAKNLGDNVDIGEKPKIGDLSFVDEK